MTGPAHLAPLGARNRRRDLVAFGLKRRSAAGLVPRSSACSVPRVLKRLSAAGAIAIAAACSGDVAALGTGTVHFVTNDGSRIAAYSAPPIGVTHQLPLLDAAGRLTFPLLRSQAPGGAYATRVDSAYVFTRATMPGSGWTLERLGSDLTVAASLPGQDIVGTDSGGIAGYQLTPDGRFFVVQRRTPPASLVVMDATTLTVIDSVSSHGSVLYFPGPIPLGTVGSQVLLDHPGPACARYFLWLDVNSGALADSATIPCGHLFFGARAPHQLYLVPDTSNAQLVLYDGQSQQRMAQQDTLGFPDQVILDAARGEIIERAGPYVVFADAATLKARRILSLVGTTPTRSFVTMALDAPSDALVALIGSYAPAERGFGLLDLSLAVVDVQQARIAAEQSVSITPVPAFVP